MSIIKALCFSCAPQISEDGPNTANPMMAVIDAQYAKLSASQFVQLRSSLARLHTLWGGRLLVGSGCSGTDLVFSVLQNLTTCWRSLLGLDFTVEHLFSVDHGALQREFITSHFTPGLLFNDMEEVSSNDMAYDELTSSLQAVPHAWLFTAGIECDTLSALNSQAKVGEGVVAKGEGKTGSSAQHCLQYLANRAPELVLFECVKGLSSGAKSSTGMSDMDTIICRANALGYIMVPRTLEALDYGMSTSRSRVYIMGFRARSCDDDFCQLPQKVKSETGEETVEEFKFPSWWHEMQNVLDAVKCEQLPMSMHYLPLNDARRSRWVAAAAKQEEKKAVAAPQWEADHCATFQQANLQWPPTFSASFERKTAHLGRRKAELVYFIENTRSAEDLSQTFADINMSIRWVCPKVGALPCLVGSSHIWCFGRKVGSDKFVGGGEGMDLPPDEALSVQGFSHTMLLSAFMESHSPQEHVSVIRSSSSHALFLARAGWTNICCRRG